MTVPADRDRARLVDVRTPEEFAGGHVRGATNVPLAELRARLGELGAPETAHVAVYCRSGRRSAEAAAVLREAGFRHVRDLGSLEAARTAVAAPPANPFPAPGLSRSSGLDSLPAERRHAMILRPLFDAPTWTYTYLVADEATREAALIDPVREQIDRDLGLVHELGLTLRYVLETHVHADHVTSAGAIRARTGAKTAASKHGAACLDVRLEHGDVLPLGSLAIEALATPGHTPDSMSFRIGEHVFTGDALFVRGTGRTDFQGGDAGALYDAITRTLFALPDATKVWPGHDYRGFGVTTIGEEKALNPRVAGKTREEFVKIMGALALAPPKRIAESVPANLACGQPAQGA